jgi:hypothetical protein
VLDTETTTTTIQFGSRGNIAAGEGRENGRVEESREKMTTASHHMSECP